MTTSRMVTGFVTIFLLFNCQRWDHTRKFGNLPEEFYVCSSAAIEKAPAFAEALLFTVTDIRIHISSKSHLPYRYRRRRTGRCIFRCS